MPRTSGNFDLIPSYFVSDGETIETDQHNPVLEDIAQALTDSLPRDGSAAMTGNLPMGAKKITNLAAGTAASDAVRKDQLDAVESDVTAAESDIAALQNRALAGLPHISTIQASDEAAVEFVGFDSSKYRGYVFYLGGVWTTTTGSNLLMRTSTDGGSSYDAGASDYNWTEWAVDYAGAGSGNAIAGTTAFRLATDLNNTQKDLSGFINLIRPDTTASQKTITAALSYTNSSGFNTATVGGRRNDTAEIDAVRFLANAGTINGTFSMYGIAI